ncbi:hypothetical protein [Natrarchaeobaculum aegyptiacum]|uniref:Uncharacterized protein n=1 Tax=Natrarchaeobaculum aegyptiacum TaxID=745377 RepID=A0A2Z2HXA9_9EURY|nr:hypothetical protein [Natrarchaeobaculum aegyptiacum]ARS91742.1 hypothetical protein B1756_08035 [Natrarchaeobaculum aegyptiacum]
MDLDDLKQPEYTGENRCLPCTVVNLTIAAALGWLVARKHRIAGVLVFVVSAAIISLRGYLVPGTPTLTRRYLPAGVLRLFGKEPDLETASGFHGVDADAAATDTHATSDTIDSADAADDGAYFDPMVEPPGPDVDVRTEPPTPEERPGPDVAATDGYGRSEPGVFDLERYFLERDVLEPCTEIDDLCLTDGFEDRWFAEIGTILETGDAAGAEPDETGADDAPAADRTADAVDAAAVIEAVGFDVDPEAFDLEARDEARFLVGNRGIAGRWPSHAAVVADVAASRALEDWVDDWHALGPETRGRVLNALRMFLERCPTGGDVELGEEVVESCCTSHDVMAVTCEETGERLFEERLDRAEA